MWGTDLLLPVKEAGHLILLETTKLVHDTSRVPPVTMPQRLLERDFSARMEKRSWGRAHRFRPMYALANMGHPSDFLRALPMTRGVVRQFSGVMSIFG
jgi:hypothetical protein